jgi:hypothetical protein
MANNVLQKREAKVALDVLYLKTIDMETFARAVAAKAAVLPRMSIHRFARVVHQEYAPYRHIFEMTLEPDGSILNIDMSATARDPAGGPGFLRIAIEMQIHDVRALTHLKLIRDVSLNITTPSVSCHLMLSGNAFRTAKPLTAAHDAAYDPSAIVYVDAALCPGCPSGPRRGESHLNYAHLVTRYAILGEKKWCRAALTPTQAFRSIDDVRVEKDLFIHPRAMVEVIGMLFNNHVAKAVELALIKKMTTVQRDACQMIARKKAHLVFAQFPLVKNMLLKRALTGQRAILSNRDILALSNNNRYATLIKHRRPSV